MTVLEKMREFISELRIIDTHEHLPREAQWAAGTDDVLSQWLAHYFSSDLVSAGLPPKVLAETVRESTKPLKKRWKVVEPFWNAARNTGYGRSLDIAARDLYGVPRVDGSTIEQLNERFVAARKETLKGKSHYRYVFKEKSRIAVSLVDVFPKPVMGYDREFFRNVYRVDPYLAPCDPVEVDRLAGETGIRIHTLDDYVAAVLAGVEKGIAQGAVALKCALAYERPIYFARVTHAEAEATFNRILGIPRGEDVGHVHMDKNKAVEDYVMHRILAYADGRGLTVQIHTGIQEGNGNILANSNPELLTNLLLEYSNVTFDLFHMSYPYQNVLSAIAKNFQNVTIDMCWAHIISPEAAVRALVEFLDAVPANKISAFGGDYLFPDGVYGHQYLAREDVARALAIKVADGCFDVERAKEVARWLFVDNPKRIFKLDV